MRLYSSREAYLRSSQIVVLLINKIDISKAVIPNFSDALITHVN